MPRLADWWFRLRAVFRPNRMERELDEEFAFHLDMERDKLIRQGLEPEAARREALRRLGGSVRPRQEVRDSWGLGLLRDAATDVRHALRQFRRRPGFSLLGIGTLGLGLGATIGLYGVVRAVLLRPLPIADEDAVRIFWSDYNWRGVEFDFVKEHAEAFSGLATFSSDGATFRTETGSSIVLAAVTSAEFFDVLGARPLLGRTFRAGEDRPGAEPVVVLSYQTWQREFGGDPDIVNRRVVLSGSPVTVIGVMPRGFYFPTPEHRIWRPLVLDPASNQYQNNGWLVLFGRVKTGLGPSRVADDLRNIARALGERFDYPAAWDKTQDPSSRSARDYLVGNVRPALLLLLGAGAMLLLMACANVAALILARTTDRGQEIALRAAIGAGRGRLVRQIVAESLTFSILAGGVGVAVAFLGFGLLVGRLPLSGDLASEVTLDWTALAAAFALRRPGQARGGARPGAGDPSGRLAASPACEGAACRPCGAGQVHRAGRRSGGGGRGTRGRRAPCSCEPCRSLAVDLGFDRTRSSQSTWPPWTPISTTGPPRTASSSNEPSRSPGSPPPPGTTGCWYETAAGRHRRSSCRTSTAPTRRTPCSGRCRRGTSIPSDRIIASAATAARRRPGTPLVAMVSRAFAERAWPGEDPIGRLVVPRVIGQDTAMVVGVVADVRSTSITGANEPGVRHPDRPAPGHRLRILSAPVPQLRPRR
ncbi:MAG: ABC transporter permease [Gemmatimonadales bacterium]